MFCSKTDRNRFADAVIKDNLAQIKARKELDFENLWAAPRTRVFLESFGMTEEWYRAFVDFTDGIAILHVLGAKGDLREGCFVQM